MAKTKPQLSLNFLSEESQEKLAKMAAARGMSPDALLNIALKNVEVRKRIISLTDKVPFGRYQGFTLEDMIRGDVRYANWMAGNATSCEFSEEAMALLNTLLEELGKIGD